MEEKKVKCPVCEQQVGVLQTRNGEEFAPHYRAPLDAEPCPTSTLHTSSFIDTQPETSTNLED